MPVNTITYQPTTAQLLAAYRPIVFRVEATSTGGDPVPPYVVCDIYIADVYYKSIIRTAAELESDVLSTWLFDISDALQEYLAPDLPAIDNSNLLQAAHISAKVFCKFRASDVDSDGFTVEEEDKPVQATRNTAAVSGDGLQSTSFFVINSALQHEDNQNLESHLDSFKTGAWKPDAFPLTHRGNYHFCNNDSDHFPLIFTGACITVDLVLNYRLKGSAVFVQATAIDLQTCDPATFTLSVTGNKVDVDLDDALPSGEAVVVQYKKQADSVWIDAGTFTTQSFFFYVTPGDADDYDIRVIHFCNSCLSGPPETDTFTLDGTVISLGWRGINPACEVIDIDPPVYIALELRDEEETDENYPDDISPITRTQTTKKDLYAKFYSDSAHLTPVNLTETGLKIFVKQIENRADDYVVGTDLHKEVESLLTYTVNPSGVNEIFLGQVTTLQLITNYSTYPTVTVITTFDYLFEPYPTHLLVGGNTGNLVFTDLEEYNTVTNTPTGTTKPNDSGDPDYIAPTPSAACAAGPDMTQVTYGSGLEISKVELHYGSTFLYADTVGDTGSGGYIYIFSIPKNTALNIAVKAKTLSVGNTTGFLKVRVTYVDSSGTTQIAEYSIPDNVETSLPATFQNVTNIAITNF